MASSGPTPINTIPEFVYVVLIFFSFWRHLLLHEDRCLTLSSNHVTRKKIVGCRNCWLFTSRRFSKETIGWIWGHDTLFGVCNELRYSVFTLYSAAPFSVWSSKGLWDTKGNTKGNTEGNTKGNTLRGVVFGIRSLSSLSILSLTCLSIFFPRVCRRRKIEGPRPFFSPLSPSLSLSLCRQSIYLR